MSRLKKKEVGHNEREMVKRVIVTGINWIIVFGIIFIPWSIVNYIEHNYTREAIVIDITDNNTIIVEDNVGHTWSFIADDNQLTVDTRVKLKLKMNDNCTSTIYDDEIWDCKIIEK